MIILIMTSTSVYSNTSESSLYKISKLSYYSDNINLEKTEIINYNNEQILEGTKFWLNIILNKYYYSKIDFNKFKYYKHAFNECDVIVYSDKDLIINVTSSFIVIKIENNIINDSNYKTDIINNELKKYINISETEIDKKYILKNNQYYVYYNKYNNQLSWKDILQIVISKECIYIVATKYDHYLKHTIQGPLLKDWL